MARPTKFNQEIADKICLQLSTSCKGLAKICEQDGMPSVRTVYNWLSDPEFAEFLHSYTRAREEQAHFMAEQIIEIADDSANDNLTTEMGEIENREWVNRSKIRIEARKWLASKLLPKKYGDKVDVTTDGEKITNLPPFMKSNESQS